MPAIIDTAIRTLTSCTGPTETFAHTMLLICSDDLRLLTQLHLRQSLCDLPAISPRSPCDLFALLPKSLIQKECGADAKKSMQFFISKAAGKTLASSVPANFLGADLSGNLLEQSHCSLRRSNYSLSRSSRFHRNQ